MSRSLHRPLVFVALTLTIAGGWWTLAHTSAVVRASAPPADHGTALALVERATDPGIVATRLRTPTPGSAATTPRRFEIASALPNRLAQHTVERPRRLPLYTLFRSLRI